MIVFRMHHILPRSHLPPKTNTSNNREVTTPKGRRACPARSSGKGTARVYSEASSKSSNNSISQRQKIDEIIRRVDNSIDESVDETIVTQPLPGTPSYIPCSDLSGVPQFGRRGTNCCLNSSGSHTTINGEKNKNICLS
jgi:hypothetical protein